MKSIELWQHFQLLKIEKINQKNKQNNVHESARKLPYAMAYMCLILSGMNPDSRGTIYNTTRFPGIFDKTVFGIARNSLLKARFTRLVSLHNILDNLLPIIS